jgi:acetyl esterase/lipase
MLASRHAAALAAALLCVFVPASFADSDTPEKPNKEMQAVLDQLALLNPKPIESLTAEEARKQPTATDAVMNLLKVQNKPVVPDDGVKIESKSIPGADGELEARVYMPKGDDQNRPLIVYFRGGGWVIATLDTYEPSARALAAQTGAVVISVNYRQAPEHAFPAAHEDAYAAVQWAAKNAASLGANGSKLAVAGESAGGNLAAAVCLMARDRGGVMPVHQLLVYPVANTTNDDPSTNLYADAKPLNKAMMSWFLKQYAPKPEDAQNKYLNILSDTGDTKALPPATVITAEIDPLKSEGEMYAKKLKDAGLDVEYKNYDGVTHEFFGMAAVLDEAKDAEKFAAGRLKDALK